MKKRLIIALSLIVLFTTYKPQNLFLINIFNIDEVEITNNFILKDEEIKKNLRFIYDTNLIFLKNYNIEKILKKHSFINSFEIKKIYPNKLKIKIFENKPVAIMQYKKKKFYINEDIDLIDYQDLEEYKNLPLVFGNQESFKLLYTSLKKINFPTDLIKRYYLYESRRWDLETYKKITIKLPIKNYIESLNNFMNLMKESSFDKYVLFDYRINNQLILK